MKLLEIVLFEKDVHWRRDAVTKYLCREQGCNYRRKPSRDPSYKKSSTGRGLWNKTTLITLKQVSTASSCLICVHVTLYSAYISCENEEYTEKKERKKNTHTHIWQIPTVLGNFKSKYIHMAWIYKCRRMLKDSGPDSRSQAFPFTMHFSDVRHCCSCSYYDDCCVSKFTGIVYCVLLACINSYAVKTKGFVHAKRPCVETVF